MEPNQIAAFKLIEAAQQAMKKGEYTTARQLAAQAAQNAPELEETWLLMAALASPRGSVAFLQKALALNPQSERAQKGMLWAQKRYQQELDKQAAAGAAAVVPVVEEQKSAVAAPEAEKPVEREIESVETVPVTQEQAVEESQPVAETFEDEKTVERKIEPAETVQQTREQAAEESKPVAEASEAEKPVEKETESTKTAPEAREQTAEETEPVSEIPEAEKPVAVARAAVLESKTAPVRKPTEARKPVVATRIIQSEKTVAKRNYSYLTIPLLLIGCFVLVFVLFLVLMNTTSAAALINSSVFNGREHGPAWAEVNVARPTQAAAIVEVVVLPTPTPLPATVPELALPPTATNLPLPTDTPLPTNTPIPTEVVPTQTETPRPTETPVPTNSPTATTEVAFVEGPSPTPLPTDTAVPVPTRYAAPTPKPNSGGGTTAGSSGERWIDVDLSRQMVFAFEGNTVINSFVVSTGTWQYPTVTGQYSVYLKYRSTTMSGPGYSLPNVPYAMYFYKSYGIHGTYWHNNFGTPMSHGCVNLTIPDAEWLYNWASIGTLVNVHY